MKALVLIFLLILFGCEAPKDHNQDVIEKFELLQPPIIVVGKECGFFGCSTLVVDCKGTKLFMGNLSNYGKVIGASYNVGDTLKF